MKTTTVLSAFSLVLAASFASAATVTWTGGPSGIGYEWVDNCWDTGTKPGPTDIARFVDIAMFQARIESGRIQSIGLKQDEEVLGIRFENAYGCSVQGSFNLTASSIYAAETGMVTTNNISAYLVLGAPETPVFVGKDHLLTLNGVKITSLGDNSYGLTKTGPGTLSFGNAYGNEYMGTTYVAEGCLDLKSYNSIRADLIVGDGVHDASVVVADGTHIQVISQLAPITVRTNGYVRMSALATPGTLYGEVYRIYGGTLDFGGNTIYQYNQAATEWGPEFVMEGGTFTNGTFNLTSSMEILPSDRTSAIYGTLSFGTGYTMDVPDGTAPVDFLVDGNLMGLNRGINKGGAGMMVVRCEDAISTWGGVAGRPFNVYGGRFFIESSDTGIGMGTNNVLVAAGASYGGIGRHVGALVQNRGVQGNVTLTGTEQARAAFVPGRIDLETGAVHPGTFIQGSEEQDGDVTFVDYGELRCAIEKDLGASCLSVNGTLTLSAHVNLAVVDTVDRRIPPGKYTLATFSKGLVGRFESITVNGVDVAETPGSVAYLDENGSHIAASTYAGAGSVVFSMPAEETVILFR